MPRYNADFHVRASTPADEPAVLALLRTALGWGDDDTFVQFFTWKHRQSPFGTSPGWVALDDKRVVGFRTFVRWKLEGPDGLVEAVRAVDTSTHPDYQRRGIFAALTHQAIEALKLDGVSLIFNTPNDRSGPGYLKMGWCPVGRIGVCVRPVSFPAVLRLPRARGAAQRWSMPVTAGVPAVEVADHCAATTLLASQPAPTGLRTHRTPAFLAWRYGFAPLHYRAVLIGGAVEDGVAVFRVRQRGAAVEATIADILVPEDDSRLRLAALKSVASLPGIDYVVGVREPRYWRAGFLPVPGQGPNLMCRALATLAVPPIMGWQLNLGDVELF